MIYPFLPLLFLNNHTNSKTKKHSQGIELQIRNQFLQDFCNLFVYSIDVFIITKNPVKNHLKGIQFHGAC